MKRILIPTLLLFFAGNSFAQEANWSPEIYQVGKMYPGYIIENDGDTIQGFLKADTRCSTAGVGTSNQNTASFYTNETDKKPVAKYKPDEIKGYRIGDKVYQSINYSGGLMKKPNFNLVVEDGAIRMYEWYATVENYAMVNQKSGESWKDFDARRFDTKIIIAKDPTEPMEHSSLGMGFAKKMPALMSDNPAMAKKVADKEKGYTFLNMFEVIKEYNTWAASKK